MKKAITVVLMLCCVNTLSAQRAIVKKKDVKEHLDKWYANLGLGYAFPHAGQVFSFLGYPYSGNATYTNNGTAFASFSNKKASLSTGMQGTIGAGYMFNEHFGVELNAGFGLSSTHYKYTASGVSISSALADLTIEQYAQSPVYLMPGIILQTGKRDNKLYMRAGLVLPLNTKVTLTQTEFYKGTVGPNGLANELDEYKLQMTSAFSIGLTSALGYSHYVTSHLKVWGEVSLLSLSVYPSEIKLTAFAVNGQAENVSSVDPTKFGLNSTGVYPSQNIGTQQTDGLPFSHIGINIGVSYGF